MYIQKRGIKKINNKFIIVGKYSCSLPRRMRPRYGKSKTRARGFRQPFGNREWRSTASAVFRR